MLLPVPAVYDVPLFRSVKVHRDHHVEIGNALYSMPSEYIGAQVQARADAQLVKLFHRGQLIKTHPRQRPGGRHTDPGDLPSERVGYAMRDLERLQRNADQHGRHFGIYVFRLLDDPLPWTRMRAVYRLLHLVRRSEPVAVDAACRTALDLDVISVNQGSLRCSPRPWNRPHRSCPPPPAGRPAGSPATRPNSPRPAAAGCTSSPTSPRPRSPPHDYHPAHCPWFAGPRTTTADQHVAQRPRARRTGPARLWSPVHHSGGPRALTVPNWSPRLGGRQPHPVRRTISLTNRFAAVSGPCRGPPVRRNGNLQQRHIQMHSATTKLRSDRYDGWTPYQKYL